MKAISQVDKPEFKEMDLSLSEIRWEPEVEEKESKEHKWKAALKLLVRVSDLLVDPLILSIWFVYPLFWLVVVS